MGRRRSRDCWMRSPPRRAVPALRDRDRFGLDRRHRRHPASRGVRVLPLGRGAVQSRRRAEPRSRAVATPFAVLMVQDAVPVGRTGSRPRRPLLDDASLAGTWARQQPHEDASLLTRYYLSRVGRAATAPRIAGPLTSAAFEALPPAERHAVCAFDNVCSCIRMSVWRAAPVSAARASPRTSSGRGTVLHAGHRLAFVPGAQSSALARAPAPTSCGAPTWCISGSRRCSACRRSRTPGAGARGCPDDAAASPAGGRGDRGRMQRRWRGPRSRRGLAARPVSRRPVGREGRELLRAGASDAHPAGRPRLSAARVRRHRDLHHDLAVALSSIADDEVFVLTREPIPQRPEYAVRRRRRARRRCSHQQHLSRLPLVRGELPESRSPRCRARRSSTGFGRTSPTSSI